MNGPHDLGGMHGFGTIEVEELSRIRARAFERPWEGRVFALVLAMGAFGDGNFDRGRQLMEQLGPDYLATPYFGRWLHMLRTRCLQDGLLSEGELRGERLSTPDPAPTAVDPETMMWIVRNGASARRPAVTTECYAVGDRVLARNIHPEGHTRLPRYVRGRRGTVVRTHGTFVLPDARAAGRGEAPEPLYSVRFAGTELWGADSDPALGVYLDLWHSHLEPEAAGREHVDHGAHASRRAHANG